MLDSRQKILLLAFSPHPDLSALKQSIESSKNYEVSLQFADKVKPAFKEYNMVILHQLPNQHAASAGIMKAVKEANVPVLYIIGSQTSLPLFNTSQGIIQIKGGGNTNESFAASAPDFQLFSISEQVQNNMLNFPPFIRPLRGIQAFAKFRDRIIPEDRCRKYKISFAALQHRHRRTRRRALR